MVGSSEVWRRTLLYAPLCPVRAAPERTQHSREPSLQSHLRSWAALLVDWEECSSELHGRLRSSHNHDPRLADTYDDDFVGALDDDRLAGRFISLVRQLVQIHARDSDDRDSRALLRRLRRKR